MNLKLKKKNIYLAIITIILVLSHKCFYLWLQDDYLYGNIKYSDIPVLLAILFAVFIRIRYGAVKEKIKKYFYMFFLISVISAFTAFFIYGQNIFRGMFAQRCQIAYLVFFFPVEKLLEKNIVDRIKIEGILRLLAWFELILCTFQYFIYSANGILFLNVGTGIRYDVGRLYFDPAILLMVVFGSYHYFLSSKKNRVTNGLLIAWVAFYLMIITKMRAMTLAFLVTLVVGLLIWRGDIIKKVFITVVGMFIGIKVLSRYAIIQDLLEAVFDLNNDATYNIRTVGRATFLSEFIKSPITGRGYPSVSSEEAISTLKGYLFVDNGIWGMVYSYGILGIIWWVAFWIKLVIKSWKIRKRQMAYFLYFLYYTVGLMTDFAWFWTATSSFSIMVALLLSEEREVRN